MRGIVQRTMLANATKRLLTLTIDYLEPRIFIRDAELRAVSFWFLKHREGILLYRHHNEGVITTIEIVKANYPYYKPTWEYLKQLDLDHNENNQP